MSAINTLEGRAPEAAMLPPFRVLALDGGGIRGYYTAMLLVGLVRHFEVSTGRANLDLGKGFDLIAGTSTGGILAAALAHGVRPERISELYKTKGPAIFPERFPKLSMNLSTLKWAFRHWERPTASVTVLKVELERVFGQTTMDNLWANRKIALTIPSISVENYGPKVFKTPHLARLTHDRGLKLSDVCLATSAAPLLFPLHPIGRSTGYFRNDLFVDGGLWANNPSLVGLLEAIEILAATSDQTRAIQIFSLGTCSGKVDQSHLKADPQGGLRTWNAGKDITELAVTTSANAMDFMSHLLAKALSASGRKVTYARIPDPEMTSVQQAALGMDRADDRAFEVMEQLAATNETRILSGIESPAAPAYRSFAEILINLPALESPIQPSVP
jgi:predicted acylesterase/phospholipase RssA